MTENGTSQPPTNPNTTAHHHPGMLSIKRRLYTRVELDNAYPYQEGPTTFWNRLKEACTCSCACFFQVILGYFPIFGVLRHYKWRSDVIPDIMAGISVTFLMIPQGFALGLLSSLPPIYGLYTTFYPAILYMIFGTSPHTSLGTNAVIAVLTASIIQSHKDGLGSSTDTILTKNSSDVTAGLFSDRDEELDFEVGVATSVAFLSGIFLAIGGFCKLGFVTKYFSTAFVQGFTTATGVHILTSQIPKLINIKIKVYSGAGKLIKTYVEIFEKIGEANPADIIISVISLAFLLLVTIYINEKFKHKLKVPVPVQLILVVITTIISHFASMKSRFDIATIGEIPSGLPAPSLPRPSDYPGIVSDSVVMAVLVFTISISLAKVTAKMNNLEMDDNQELVAYGLTGMLSSFFGCYAVCNAPPRAMILSGVGARSTLHAIISGIMVLIVLLVAGPLFTALPVAVLAAMICAAIKNLLLQFNRLPFLWRTSKPDFVIWTLTCLISVFADLDIGIVAGILVSFLTVIVKNQLTSGSTGAISANEDLILLDGDRKGLTSSDGFIIYYFPSQLYFANSECFKKDLFSKAFNPREATDELTNSESEEIAKDENSQKRICLKYIIIQCSALTYIDLDGAVMMKEVAELYLKVGVKVILSNVPSYTLHLLERVGYFQKISDDSVYFDIHDAVSFVMEEKRLESH